MKRMIAGLFVIFVLVSVLCTRVDAATSEQKEWTFMVFMNGDNTLDANTVKDMREMRNGGGSNDFMNLVVMVDRENKPAYTYFVTKEKNVELAKHGEVDMGDYKVFVNFVKDTVKAYPAKHYCAIIWNHGTGWKAVRNKEKMIRGISYDDQSGNNITTAQLGYAMADIKKALGRRLDLLCFDACLMQMAEVIPSVREGADIMVGSEEIEPGDGFPYKDILKGLKSGMKADDVARLIVRCYAASYDDGSAGYSSSTMSALYTNAYEGFKDCLNAYCKMVMASDYSTQIDKIFDEIQKFQYDTNIDLYHFVSLSKSKIKNGGIKTTGDKLLAAIKRMVFTNAVSGYGTGNANGLAIYFPQLSHKFSTDYTHLPFAKNTMWMTMVRDYYKKSVIKPILEEVENGRTDKLKNYVAKACENNRGLTLELIAKLNYLCFTEGKCNEKTAKRVKALISELKNK